MSYLYSLSQTWDTDATGVGLEEVKSCFIFPSYAIALSEERIQSYCSERYHDGDNTAESMITGMLEAGVDWNNIDVVADMHKAFRQSQMIQYESVQIDLTNEAQTVLENILHRVAYQYALTPSEVLDLLPETVDAGTQNELLNALEPYQY